MTASRAAMSFSPAASAMRRAFRIGASIGACARAKLRTVVYQLSMAQVETEQATGRSDRPGW
jgi:hypothetical protein